MKIVGAVLVMMLAACGSNDSKTDAQTGDGASQIDSQQQIDATLADAPPPDGAGSGSTDVATACSHICDALAACLMMPPDPSCNSGCESDLSDCTPQQVQAVDQCSMQQCGTDGQDMINCVTMVSCVMG